MRFRPVCVLAAAMTFGLWAQTTLSVEQLFSFIKSSIQLKHPDRQVANFVSKLKLSEKLDDRTIEELQGLGAGPHTLEALRALRDASASLPAPRAKVTAPPAAPIPPPSPQEQERILAALREYAENYSRRLPDFICTQVTRRYVDPSGLEFWQAADTLTVRLSYFEQKEEYKLILVNNTVATQAYESLGGATSTGEFGSMLREIFEKESRARFQWERWATLRGKRTHVFSYRVPQPNSKWHIDYERRLDIVAGYHGLIYVDRDTNKVLRITLVAEDIPPSFPVNEASTTLDYDYTEISGQQYLLPLRAVMRMRSGKLLTRNDVEFRMYRKFSAEATINFETPPPLEEDQLKEQPPK
jgi:hypothetical protein